MSLNKSSIYVAVTLTCSLLLGGCSVPVSGLASDSADAIGLRSAGKNANLQLILRGSPWLGSSQLTVLHTFQGGSDGARPRADLIAVRGTLYGTTSGLETCGTAFALTTAGTETVLHDFTGASDGCAPSGPLVFVNGAFYGTTSAGGDGDCSSGPLSGCGTVFKLTSSGVYNVIYRFKGGLDGSMPHAGLTYLDGNLYGTTFFGGTYGAGTAFVISPSGEETVLHSFGARRDGAYPGAAPTAVGGVLYGTTTGGGGDTYLGTVYSLTEAGAEKVLHSFRYTRNSTGDCAAPSASLTIVGAALYGTGSQGGANGTGCVFQITLNGKKKATESILYNFQRFGGDDGAFPFGDLSYANGVLTGTTTFGGTDDSGTVYTVTTSGVEMVLYDFPGGPTANGPLAGVTPLNGVFYGTTYLGGVDNSTGVVFSLAQ